MSFVFSAQSPKALIMLVQRGFSTALPSSSRLPITRRAITSSPIVFRQQIERRPCSPFFPIVHPRLTSATVPSGHVRPHRRPTAHRFQNPPQFQNFVPPEPLSIGQELSVAPRPVSIPNDPKGVLQESHAVRELLGHETLVIVR